MKFWRKHLPDLNKVRQIFYRLGLLAGASILVYQLIRGLIILSHAQQNIHLKTPANLLLGLGLAMVAVVFQVTGWKTLMQALNVRIPYWTAFRGYVISFLPRYIPGTIWGYLSRSEWLKNEMGVNYSITNFGSVLETIVIILANLLFVFYAQYPLKWLVIPPGLGITCVLCFAILIWGILYVAIKKWGNHPRFKRWAPELNIKAFRLDRWIWSLFFFTCMWSAFGTSLWLILNTFVPDKVSLTLSGWYQIAGYYDISWLIGFLILFVPAGLGIREAVLASLLTTNLGINQGISNELAIFFRLVIVLSEFIWAGICIGWTMNQTRRKKTRIQE